MSLLARCTAGGRRPRPDQSTLARASTAHCGLLNPFSAWSQGLERRFGAVVRKTPTIRDVARLAAVSPATVSLVLNEVADTRISEGTAARVRAAAAELEYAPNSLARGLRRRRCGARRDDAPGPATGGRLHLRPDVPPGGGPAGRLTGPHGTAQRAHQAGGSSGRGARRPGWRLCGGDRAVGARAPADRLPQRRPHATSRSATVGGVPRCATRVRDPVGPQAGC